MINQYNVSFYPAEILIYVVSLIVACLVARMFESPIKGTVLGCFAAVGTGLLGTAVSGLLFDSAMDAEFFYEANN